MTKRSVHISTRIGPGAVNANTYVDIAPVYSFDDGVNRNWDAPKSYKLENGEVTITGMEDHDGADWLPWLFKFRNLDARNQPIDLIPVETVTFEDTSGSPVEYVNMKHVAEIGSERYWLAQGPKGDDGADGADGSPGVNAVANDVATAAQINSETSQTRAALNATILMPAQLAGKFGDGWIAEAFAPPPADDMPTITAASSSQISGGSAVQPTASYWADPTFRYDGTNEVIVQLDGVYGGSNGALSAQVTPETVTDAQDIEFRYRIGRTTGTNVLGARAVVNGKMCQLRMLRYNGATGDMYFRLHFPTARVRTIRMETDGFNLFRGVIVGTKTILQRPTAPIRCRYVAIGDSLQQGGPDLDYFRYESHSRFLAQLMGADSYINLGVGGSGFVNPAGASDPFSNRVPLALACNPHILSIFGSRNDTGLSAVLAAVINTLALAQDVPMVNVCGPQQAGFSALNETVRQGVIVAGRKWIDLDGLAQSPTTAPAGHPTFQEQLDLAAAAYVQLDRTVIDATVQAVNAARPVPSVAVTTTPPAAATTGANVTITAALSSNLAGTVEFYDGNTLIGSATVASSAASFTTSSLTAGTHALSAKFVPTNPLVARSYRSAPVTLVVDSNLGFADDYNRADGAVGSTTNGKAYATTGTWLVSGNKLLFPNASGLCDVDAGTPNVDFQFTISGTLAAAVQATIRKVDGGNFLFVNNQGLYEIVANGSSVQLAASSPTGFAAGDVVRITAIGNVITMRKNGTIILTHTTTRFNAATRFGWRSSSGVTNAYVDDVTCVPS